MGKKLKEVIDENYEPTAKEIIKYGTWLGLSLPDDEDLLYIAREGLKDPLPHPWVRCKTRKGNIYYFNFETHESKLEHPCDSYYKQLVREAKHLNGAENVKPKTMTSLLNYQISNTNDFNSKLKETENALNAIDILRNKTAEILSRSNNPELEIDFRATCSNYQTNSTLHDSSLIQAYQDYLDAYQQKTSLYSFRENYYRTNLIIYKTETETQEVKILKISKPLDPGTCITQLQNRKLFCFGNSSYSGITVLIDVNGGVEVLPSGTPCRHSSCIYFNNSVYCFGGENNMAFLTLSNRFDLDRKRWIQLVPMPKADCCNSIIFNGNILITGYNNRNILLYSIDINSFSTIPYEFEEDERKILINAERLYLIEGAGSIYESEIGSYTNWRLIAKSKIIFNPSQMHFSYNKGGIYIGCAYFSHIDYYKFDLNKKLIIKL